MSRKNILLIEFARGLKKNKPCNTVDRLSTNLMNIDDIQKQIIKENYEKEVLNFLRSKDEYVIVTNDDSDSNHGYSKKMEEICLVRDANSKYEKYVNGYKVCEYIALSPKEKSPISLYSKIYSTVNDDFKSENDETILGEDEVIRQLKK